MKHAAAVVAATVFVDNIFIVSILILVFVAVIIGSVNVKKNTIAAVPHRCSGISTIATIPTQSADPHNPSHA